MNLIDAGEVESEFTDQADNAGIFASLNFLRVF